ncbi:hypothetical protein MUK42_29603 [Musa troglodytarum]|uniref:Uncharacterized protein n=1 Tax=Musa troglodytarum TaxID=320322 RepID=A0A9E7EMW3_9LILI|nr:hypothetical protein MUK42_29603 [Musa troglodytarum]
MAKGFFNAGFSSAVRIEFLTIHGSHLLQLLQPCPLPGGAFGGRGEKEYKLRTVKQLESEFGRNACKEVLPATMSYGKAEG